MLHCEVIPNYFLKAVFLQLGCQTGNIFLGDILQKYQLLRLYYPVHLQVILGEKMHNYMYLHHGYQHLVDMISVKKEIEHVPCLSFAFHNIDYKSIYVYLVIYFGYKRNVFLALWVSELI